MTTFVFQICFKTYVVKIIIFLQQTEGAKFIVDIYKNQKSTFLTNIPKDGSIQCIRFPMLRTHNVSKKLGKTRTQRVITLRNQFCLRNRLIQYVTDCTGLRLCQVELRFSSCVCVYRQEKMCPVHYIVEYT